MFESLKKTIEDSEAVTAKLKHLAERVQILIDNAKKDQDELTKKITILEREVNDVIFDQKNGKTVFDKLSPSDCLWTKLSQADRMKPLGMSCPCPRCSPYSISFRTIKGEPHIHVQATKTNDFAHMILNKPVYKE